jgi:hypothetical protein
MPTVSTSRVIHAPITRVWEVFSDIPHGADHMSAITRLEVLSDQPFGPGYRWRETRRMFGREATEEMWVSAAQEPDFYEVAAESHGSKYLSRFDFTEVPEGTRVDYTFSGEPTSSAAKVLGAATGWMLKGTLTKQLDADLADLAAACERS